MRSLLFLSIIFYNIIIVPLQGSPKEIGCLAPQQSVPDWYFLVVYVLCGGFPGGASGKNPPANAGDVVSTFPLLRAAIFATITMPIVTYNLIFPFLIHCF